MGVIVDVKPGPDGLIRRVWVRVASKGGPPLVLERSVRDTVLLVPGCESPEKILSPTKGESLVNDSTEAGE